MPLPAYLSEAGNMQSTGDVCSSFDFLCENPRISGTAEARDFKLCVLIES